MFLRIVVFIQLIEREKKDFQSPSALSISVARLCCDASAVQRYWITSFMGRLGGFQFLGVREVDCNCSNCNHQMKKKKGDCAERISLCLRLWKTLTHYPNCKRTTAAEKEITFCSRDWRKAANQPAQNVTVSAVHPLDYVISELLASIISTEWQADGLATLENILRGEHNSPMKCVTVLVQFLQD